MKKILCLCVIGLFLPLKSQDSASHVARPVSTADTVISRTQLLKDLASKHAGLTRQFQYLLTPEQLDLQERIREALVQLQTVSAIKNDTLIVSKPNIKQ